MEKSSFVGYEYYEVAVKRRVVSLYADGYKNFGWKLEGTEEQPGKQPVDTITMKFKRDRKICNKTELTRLQHNFDACVSEILSLELSKSVKASIAAFAIGIVGTAFMTGAVFAVIAGNILPGIILAIPACIGFVLPYFLYRCMEKKKTTQVEPLIDLKYEELYTVCEKAHSLLACVNE